MAYSFPEGSRFYFASVFAAPKTITAVTNANPAVATCTSHGYTAGDELVFSSGWDDATDTVWRMGAIDVNTFQLTGLDSSSTSWYPNGSGTGTTKKVTTWVEMLQVLNISTSGGDARFTTIEPLSRRNAISAPTGFNPSSITLTLGYDPTLSYVDTLKGLSRTLSPTAIKIAVSGAGTAYGYGYISASEVPQ